MPRNYGRFKGNQMRWKRTGERDGDDFKRDSNLHIRREQDGGRSAFGRRSFPQNGNVEMIKRAVAMNLLPTSTGTSTSSGDTGLGPGEAWTRITIIYGANHALNLLQEMVNMAFGTQLRFYNACAEGRNTVMYAKIRQKQLTAFRRALQTLKDPNDNNKSLVADITVVPEPRVPPTNPSNGVTGHLPESWMEALRQCFLERYQSTNRSLDLSNLHNDPGLLSKGLYLPLNRPAVVYSMISILKDNSAKLATINLSNNRMPHMNNFSPLASNGSEASVVVERIDLSGNPLTNIPGLCGLRGIAGLEELDLSDTILMNRMQGNFRFWAAKLIKYLPGVKKLNGEYLPKTVLFAVEQGDSDQLNAPNRVPLPTSSLGHFPNDDVKVSLLYFLKEYFSHFDSIPRGENVLQHYTTDSRLVISASTETRSPCAPQLLVSNQLDGAGDSAFTSSLKTYLLTSRLSGGHLQLSRNLLRCHDDYRRRDLVMRGSIAISASLDKLPPTEHPLGSLSVDVAFASSSQMVFTVTGVFYELSDRNLSIADDYSRQTISSSSNDGRTVYKTLRCFSRTMIVVAPNGHIMHDDFIISNPSKLLIKKYIEDVVKESTGSKRMETTTASGSSSATANTVAALEPDMKQVLTDQLRQRTGLNINFARQCLEEYNWDLSSAASAFDTLNLAGSIPPEAFV